MDARSSDIHPQSTSSLSATTLACIMLSGVRLHQNLHDQARAESLTLFTCCVARKVAILHALDIPSEPQETASTQRPRYISTRVLHIQVSHTLPPPRADLQDGELGFHTIASSYQLQRPRLNDHALARVVVLDTRQSCHFLVGIMLRYVRTDINL